MMYQASRLSRLTRQIANSIEEDLTRSGMLFRISSRSKSHESIEKKIGVKAYDGRSTFLQDIIGVRINLFFIDDLPIVHNFLKTSSSKFTFLSETIDKNLETEFKPTRINLIFKLPIDAIREFTDIIADERIDKTYEVQLRTVLSEGWHEVDHDLRYKCPNDWIDHQDLSRFFNGILASLETSDFSILNLFDQISYRHYKSKNWSAMIRTKLRIRIQENQISPDLKAMIERDSDLQKNLFKIDRNHLMTCLLKDNYFFPLKLDNVIYLINHLFIKHDGISSITPDGILDVFKLQRT